MVRDHPDRNIILIYDPIFFSGQSAHVITQRLDRIHIKNRIHILHDGCKTLQPHAGVNILLFQFAVIAVAVIVKLGEYVVPDLHIAVALTAYRTVRLAAAVLLSAVIIDLRAGAAGAGTMLPEVVPFSEFEDPLCRDPHFFVPDLKRLVIFLIYGRIQSVRIQSHDLGQKLPGPLDGFLFKIVSKRKIPQHLEKSTVTGGLSHILDISRTDTLLAGGHPSPGRNLLPCKIRLQRRHPRIDEQQALIVVRHQGKALHSKMSLTLKELQKHFSQLVHSILVHLFHPPIDPIRLFFIISQRFLFVNLKSLQNFLCIVNGLHGVLPVKIRPDHIGIFLVQHRSSDHDPALWRFLFQKPDGLLHADHSGRHQRT